MTSQATRSWSGETPISPASQSGWPASGEHKKGNTPVNSASISPPPSKQGESLPLSDAAQSSESSRHEQFIDSDTDSETHRAAVITGFGCYSEDEEVFIIAGADIPRYLQSLGEQN